MALGGIVSSISLLMMFLTGVFPVLYLVLPMIAGAMMIIISEEIGSRWAFLTFAAVGILSLFITFDKEAAIMFIMFFGHYPITKKYIEKIKQTPLKLIVKLLIFNVCIVTAYQLTIYIMGVNELAEDFMEFGKYGLYILLGFSNIIFLTYDYSVDGLIRLYRTWFKPKFLRGR